MKLVLKQQATFIPLQNARDRIDALKILK